MNTHTIETVEDGCGYYVYGIVGRSGVPDVSDTQAGIDPAHAIYTLPYRSIRAVASKVDLREFGQEALEANMHDLEWLKAKVCVHESIVEAVSAQCVTIPMKFGVIFLSESRVEEMLANYHDDFVGTLHRLEGSKEWGVKVGCNDEALSRRATDVSDKLSKLTAELAEKSGGAAYIWEKRLQGALAAEMAQISDDCAQSSHDRLSNRAEEAVTNPVLGKDLTGEAEQTILNGAYLVSEDNIEAFRVELAHLQDEYGPLGFSFRLTGPWSPYNFTDGNLAEGSRRR